MSEFNPQPKFEYLRSEKHLNIVRSLECQMCGASPRSQAAHSNSLKFGKGRGIKSSDESVLGLCAECHSGYDQTKTKAAHEKTFLLLLGHQSIRLKREGRLLPDVERLLIERGVL